MKGEQAPADAREAWELLRSPLPPASEDPLFAALRLGAGIDDRRFFSDRGFSSFDPFTQANIGQALAPGYFQHQNPLVRHTVLRRRETLEEQGLLERVGVTVHPHPKMGLNAYPGQSFAGLGLLTNRPFDLAYKAAEDFTAGTGGSHRGGRLHEVAAAAAHLLQLRFRQSHCRADAAPGDPGRRGRRGASSGRARAR